MRSWCFCTARRSPTMYPLRCKRTPTLSASTWERTMLRIHNLSAGYGSLNVLRRVSLHVKAGEIVTIIGANGAGKTTLLKTITGLLRAQSGDVLFQDEDIQRVPPEQVVLRGCSLVPEGRQVFAAMPVRENLLLGGY